ncbi:hypothetical protein DSCW_63060 [Desulfosarcina widdelii]|uniref:PilZ domain-containing protein n=1 Tax=Desulfosarcina widdelii TaxID=947919 RepID=A0A5K7ZFG1_9BACT|nr:PilZ domain-containing protein [Desulfosarcina widdelii]BBO78889.1 hypothetical protein DSCW_63060 [Desulfosarcina widdelii]
MEGNKRQHPRKAAFIIAEYTTNKGTFKDVLKNIGADGLFVRTWRKFEYGTPIVLKFPLFSFDQIIQASGKVIRNEHNGFAVSFDKRINGLVCKEGHLPEIVHESNRISLK